MKPMKSKYLFLLFFATLLTACSNHTRCPMDLPTHCWFCFLNQSRHTICVTDDLKSWELQPKQTQEGWLRVDCGKSLIFHYVEGMDIDHNDRIVFSGITKVVFDNKYEITHTDDMPHSLFNVASYSVDISHRQMTEDYTYTFTDEDYEYAVANGVVIGE